jgi:hypothetical protein
VSTIQRNEANEGKETNTLNRRRHNLEVRRDVATEDTGFERLDVTSDVRFRLQQVAIVHVSVRLDVAIGEDDVAFPRFDLYVRKGRGGRKWERGRGENQYEKVERGGGRRPTMRSVSHNVPDPLRRTSSGLSGMMLQREKTKGWTYFM